MDDVKILIVDDSRTSKRILRNLLESQGYTVVAEAADGEEGYQKYFKKVVFAIFSAIG